MRRLPSYALGYEAGVTEGEARGKAESQRAIVRQLLRRLDPARVAELLDVTAGEVMRIAKDRGPNG